jgi:Cu/Ag efflux pump CusA
VIGGLATSTFLTLVIIPVVYMSFETMLERIKRRKTA